MSKSSKRHVNSWSQEEDDLVADLYSKGQTYREISSQMPGRTKQAVYYRIKFAKKLTDPSLTNADLFAGNARVTDLTILSEFGHLILPQLRSKLITLNTEARKISDFIRLLETKETKYSEPEVFIVDPGNNGIKSTNGVPDMPSVKSPKHKLKRGNNTNGKTKLRPRNVRGQLKSIGEALAKSPRAMNVDEIVSHIEKEYNLPKSGAKRKRFRESVRSTLSSYFTGGKKTKDGFSFERIQENGTFYYSVKNEPVTA